MSRKEFSYDMKSKFDVHEMKELKMSVTDKIGTPPSVVRSTSRGKISRSDQVIMKSTPKINLHDTQQSLVTQVATWDIPIIKIPIIPRYE